MTLQTRSEFAFELGEPFRALWIFHWRELRSHLLYAPRDMQISVDDFAQPCRRGGNAGTGAVFPLSTEQAVTMHMLAADISGRSVTWQVIEEPRLRNGPC